ncbi:unnamed protein product, partial [Vitis vinifera]|uniref:Uncharacterized protein n=1 Tax=Vitis vinifera TaxID=29760 RepID=E0CSN0_VITVI
MKSMVDFFFFPSQLMRIRGLLFDLFLGNVGLTEGK